MSQTIIKPANQAVTKTDFATVAKTFDIGWLLPTVVSMKGKLPGVPDFTKSDGRLSKDADVLATHIMEGFKSPGSSMAMPAKGGISSLTMEQAEAIVQYLRQAFSGK